MMGDCTNDTLTITGADAVTNKNLPTNLCGVLTGQHIYLSVKSSSSVQLTIKLASIGTQKWKILLRQFDSSQTDYLAPRGCLQYYRADSGSIASFNSAGGSPELLNDHMYSICIAQNDLYCDIALTANSFDLTGTSGSCSDSIAFGFNVACGSSLTFSTCNILNNSTRIRGVTVFMFRELHRLIHDSRHVRQRQLGNGHRLRYRLRAPSLLIWPHFDDI